MPPCHSEIWASALPVRASTASRPNVNLNILFIELPDEATARLSTSPSFAGARTTVRQKGPTSASGQNQKSSVRAYVFRFAPISGHRQLDGHVRKVPFASFWPSIGDVRFTPVNGHHHCPPPRLKGAKLGSVVDTQQKARQLWPGLSSNHSWPISTWQPPDRRKYNSGGPYRYRRPG